MDSQNFPSDRQVDMGTVDPTFVEDTNDPIGCQLVIACEGYSIRVEVSMAYATDGDAGQRLVFVYLLTPNDISVGNRVGSQTSQTASFQLAPGESFEPPVVNQSWVSFKYPETQNEKGFQTAFCKATLAMLSAANILNGAIDQSNSTAATRLMETFSNNGWVATLT